MSERVRIRIISDDCLVSGRGLVSSFLFLVSSPVGAGRSQNIGQMGRIGPILENLRLDSPELEGVGRDVAIR